jgi:hypothetical protein
VEILLSLSILKFPISHTLTLSLSLSLFLSLFNSLSPLTLTGLLPVPVAVCHVKPNKLEKRTIFPHLAFLSLSLLEEHIFVPVSEHDNKTECEQDRMRTRQNANTTSRQLVFFLAFIDRTRTLYIIYCRRTPQPPNNVGHAQRGRCLPPPIKTAC